MSKKELRAIEALEQAQKIAFAPFVFQTTVSLRKLGVLNYIFDNRDKGGVSINEISKALSVSVYGIGVLLEIAESSDIVIKDAEKKYQLTKTGYFLNYNKTVEVNLNFTNDVCYEGLFYLNDAIKEQKPSGLKVFGEWDTIYDGLSQLSPEVQKSWFEFDHHYSDGIFEEALKRVFKNDPKTIYDIGGNTGKFALQCFNYNKDVTINIFDLPGQLKKALENIKNNDFENRVSGHEINWLKPNPQIPKGADLIWMSQFLDCFSEDEILTILKTCVASMNKNTELIIIETFTDRQKFDNARFSLEATSLYFTALANGTSKMYPADVFETLIKKAGLTLNEDHQLGEYHTMMVCSKTM
ncbi:methyltransferase [Psychroserpens jangbogonensis]|uniref:methyltransferase n=1 Tax=Psychroserpens jangbogonensis TaxID=1484460 RepID=UPI00053D7844|nr:methyltransferase [Psychroserpens jangbogonensis]